MIKGGCNSNPVFETKKTYHTLASTILRQNLINYALLYWTYRILLPKQLSITASATDIMDVRPTNESILQTDLSSYLDSLDDKLRKTTKEHRIRELIDRITIIPPGWPNSIRLRQLPHAIQWHPALPDYGGSTTPLRDVYLVSIPHWSWPTSFKHWSLYSQGSFFHLVLRQNGVDVPIETFTMEEVESELESLKWQIQGDNVHRLNAYAAPDRQIPMVAYSIGQTQFNATQIECLAKGISSAFDKYSKQEKNCHLFVLSLATRVLMTKGPGTIFVGTRAQIVHWDTISATGKHSSPYSQEEGYLLRAPSHGRSPSIQRSHVHADVDRND